jgi:cell shape-determining protein MreC
LCVAFEKTNERCLQLEQSRDDSLKQLNDFKQQFSTIEQQLQKSLESQNENEKEQLLNDEINRLLQKLKSIEEKNDKLQVIFF